MGRTMAPERLGSADDLLEVLLGFTTEVSAGADFLVVGHSVGAGSTSSSTPPKWCGTTSVSSRRVLHSWTRRRWSGSAHGGNGPVDAYGGPTLIVAGRLDSTVGYAAAIDSFGRHPRAPLAVIDEAGHALPHEEPAVVRALRADWLEPVVARATEERRPATCRSGDAGGRIRRPGAAFAPGAPAAGRSRRSPSGSRHSRPVG
jgi:hypothetical protein